MKSETSLFFLTLSLICVWVIIDNFVGHKYVDNLIGNLITGGNFKTSKQLMDEAEQRVNKAIQDVIDMTPEERAEYFNEDYTMKDFVKDYMKKDADDIFYGLMDPEPFLNS